MGIWGIWKLNGTRDMTGDLIVECIQTGYYQERASEYSVTCGWCVLVGDGSGGWLN